MDFAYHLNGKNVNFLHYSLLIVLHEYISFIEKIFKENIRSMFRKHLHFKKFKSENFQLISIIFISYFI